MTVIIFIFILSLLVIVHELGHFIAAKAAGVLVEEFGIGFPPRIFGIKKGETLYSLNLIPLGGFVKLYGEEYVEAKSKINLTADKKNSKSNNRAFVYKKPWQKALIIAAGVIGNFLLGWVLISFLFTKGVPVPTNKVIIEKVQTGSPAEKAGLKEKDVVVSFISKASSVSIKSPNEFIALTKKSAGQQIKLVVLRENKKLTVELSPRKNPPPGQGPMGVMISSFVEKKYPWYQAPFLGLVEAFAITRKIVMEIIKTIYQFISLQKPSVEVAGPIGITAYTAKALKFGQNAFLEFIALLSLNLAVINILPFPALDGGRLVFVVYEWISKKRVNQKIERYVNFIGIIILLSLAVLVSLNDLSKIIH
ncbi:MAG: RIP metalloprotease RseP [Microgenomates group bacterium]